MKFAANISTFFQAEIMSARFNKAVTSGFKAVEVQFLYNQDKLRDILAARSNANVEFVLMNSPYEPGPLFPKEDCPFNTEIGAVTNYAAGSKVLLNLKEGSAEETAFRDPPFGMACLSDKRQEFVNSIYSCVRLCEVLKCRKLHILAGIKPQPQYMTFETCEENYLYNLEWALNFLEEYQVQVVIEPLCEETKPGYFLNSFEQAVKYVKHFNNDNLKLLLDVYHLYKIEGDVEAGLKKYLPFASHIQISQSPGRNDPFINGDIDYENVLKIIKESSYDGYIGLEYTPANPTDPDFTWMSTYTEV